MANLECNVIKKALGPSDCPQMPGMLVGMITTGPNFSLSEAEAVDPDVWQQKLYEDGQDRANVWPRFVQFENLSEEAVYEDLPSGLIFVRQGNYRFRFMAKESLCLHKKMYTHRGQSGRAFLLDDEGQLIGTQGADGRIRGLSYQMLNMEKM